jgi:hypothetical protein
MPHLSKCNVQQTANSFVRSSIPYNYTFQAFGDVLQTTTAPHDVTRDALMKAPPFTLTYRTTSHAIIGICSVRAQTYSMHTHCSL